jgi:hypothetical protein
MKTAVERFDAALAAEDPFDLPPPQQKYSFGESYPTVKSHDAAVDLARTQNVPVRAWIISEWHGQSYRTPVKAYPSGSYRFERITD